MAVGDRVDRFDEFDRYDRTYPPDATEADLAEYEAAAEREDLRRDMEREKWTWR